MTAPNKLVHSRSCPNFGIDEFSPYPTHMHAGYIVEITLVSYKRFQILISVQ